MSTLTVVPRQPDRLTEQVAAEVRAQMARVRITQTQLAESLGLTQSSISKRLRGVVAFNTDELQIVAGVLGVHPAAFFGVYSPSPNSPVTAPSPITENTLCDDNVIVLKVGSQSRSGAMRTTRPAVAA
jgi:transcriptional regulator with XRE-family HTH domain